MRIFITGGCKNGKSYYAQTLAKAQQGLPLYYVATMEPRDEEDRLRIARHLKEREGWGFVTVEQLMALRGVEPESGCIYTALPPNASGGPIH